MFHHRHTASAPHPTSSYVTGAHLGLGFLSREETCSVIAGAPRHSAVVGKRTRQVSMAEAPKPATGTKAFKFISISEAKSLTRVPVSKRGTQRERSKN